MGQYIVLDDRAPCHLSPGHSQWDEHSFYPCRTLINGIRKKEDLNKADQQNIDMMESILKNHESAGKVFDGLSMERLIVADEELTKRERAAIKAIGRTLNDLRFYRKVVAGYAPDKQSAAWTDCRTYIAIERSTLALAEKGMRGATAIMQIVFHELAHVDDGETHDGAFYKRFHDLMMSPYYGEIFEALYKASRSFVVNYDSYLETYRVPRSKSLDKSLMLAMKKYRTRKESVEFHNRKKAARPRSNEQK